MKFPVWPLRFLILIYFFYKMFVSNPPNPFASMVTFEGKAPGEIAGEMVVVLLFTFLFSLFYFYQISQGLIDMKGSIEVRKVRFRLFSIVFSIIFFSLAGLSLVNVDFSNIDIVDYSLELYTIFTFISVIASVVVIANDIKLFREFKRIKNANAL